MKKQNSFINEQNILKQKVATKSLEYIKSVFHNSSACFDFEQMVWLNYHFLEIEKIYNNYGHSGLLQFYETHSKEGMLEVIPKIKSGSNAVVEFKQRLVLNEKIVGAYINQPKEYKLKTTFPNAKVILFNKVCDGNNPDMPVLFDFLVLKHIAQIIGASSQSDLFVTEKEMQRYKQKSKTTALLKKIYTK